MQPTESHRRYWRKNLAVTAALLLVWFSVSFGVSYFARSLNFTFFGWPFSFWMGAQGALVVYCLIVGFYAWYMQIILLDKVVNLGNLGEIVKVKDGYARNFLIPSGRARRATEANKAEFEAKRVELEKAAAAKLAEMQAQGEKLSGTTVKLTQKAGVDGRLFGSVTNHDISAELTLAGGAGVAQHRHAHGLALFYVLQQVAHGW